MNLMITMICISDDCNDYDDKDDYEDYNDDSIQDGDYDHLIPFK